MDFMAYLGARNTRWEMRASITVGREDSGSFGSLAASHEAATKAMTATTSWEGVEARFRDLMAESCLVNLK
jgi:hypothetical protein